MKHQCLELERFQASADIACKMSAVATLSQADVDQEVLKLGVQDDTIFACETARRCVRRHRQQLGFARIHVRPERRERFAQVLDRSLVSCPGCAYANGERKDENKWANHVNKVSKVTADHTKITDVSGECSRLDLSGPSFGAEADRRLEKSGLRLKNGGEVIAMHPKKKEREDGDDAGQRETTRIEKNVIEHDVHDYRAEQGQAERDETPNEQKQTADDLKNGDGVYVAAVDERSDKRASLALHWRHRNEVQKGVGPQDDEDDPEQHSGDDDGVFHRCWCSFSPNKLDLPTTLLA